MEALETFKLAGLRPKHLAAVLGVSRVTASIWLNGHGKPHVLLLDKVSDLAERVSHSMSVGELPFPGYVSKSDEVKYLKDILIK